MAWVVAEQQDNGCLLVDSENPRIKRLCRAQGQINQDGAPVDFDLTRVDNALLNGWRVANNTPWHFVLQGFPETGTQRPQGTVGFGGKRGQHFVTFRLEEIGYLHGPSKQWTTIADNPNYDRAHLTSTPIDHQFPDQTRRMGQNVTWANLWTTPGGGDVSVRWGVSAGKLKEDVVINQAGREWIAANQPPTTPANQTWFALRFDIDASDIPKIVKNNIQQSIEFDDDDGPLELRTTLNELLAFMPIDFAHVPSRGGRVRLQKRVFGGKLYVGAKVSDFVNLLPGDVIFDPSFSNETIGADSDDVHQDASGFNLSYNNRNYIGEYANAVINTGLRFTTIAIPPGSTVTASTLQVYRENAAGSSITGDIFSDTTSGATWSSGDPPTLANIVESANSVLWTIGGTNNTYISSPDISAVLQDRIDDGSWATNGDVRFAIEGNLASGTDNNVGFYDRAAGTANLPLFDATWTEPAGGTEWRGLLVKRSNLDRIH